MQVKGLNDSELKDFTAFLDYIKKETKKYLDFDISFDYNINIYSNIDDFYSEANVDKRGVNSTYLLKVVDTNIYVYILFKDRKGLYKLLAKKLVELELSKYIKDQTFLEGFSIYVTGFNSSNHKIYSKFKVWYLNKIVRRDKFIPKADAIKNKMYQGYENYAFLIAIYLVRNFNLKDGNILSSNYLTDEFIKEVISHFNKFFKTSEIKRNFYDVDTPEELLDFLCMNFIYGYVDENGNKHFDLKDMKNSYKTGNINKSLNTLMGTCLENTNLEKYWFTSHGYKSFIFIWRLYENDDNYKMHSFLVYKDKDGDSWNYFEYTRLNNAGIYKFNSLEEALKSFVDNSPDERELILLNEFKENLTFKEFNKMLDSLTPCNYKKNKM